MTGHEANAGSLPVCQNRVIASVVKRAGCTIGDTRCWSRAGGFCTDYVEKRLAASGAGAPAKLAAIAPEEVRQGDVAAFASRAHYAFVERVVRDSAGTAVSVDVAEFNFGSCWVDEGAMVTERFAVVGRRRVALRDVDGGFLRARTVPR
jgi:hypothetical protein